MTDYRLPVGIISESTNNVDMLGDFIAWMSTDALFEAMNGHSKAGSGGYGRWNAEDYYVSSINYKLEERPETEVNSDCAVMIFDAMKDISPFLPKDHMFGFSEGKLGIFYCPITITVEPEEKPKPKFKFLYADPGFCRTYYRALYGAKLLYCFQNDGGFGRDQINFYMCSHDGEPDTLCVMPEDHELDFVHKP